MTDAENSLFSDISKPVLGYTKIDVNHHILSHINQCVVQYLSRWKALDEIETIHSIRQISYLSCSDFFKVYQTVEAVY